MIHENAIKRLNRQFAEFGYTPSGDLKFKWARTEDLPVFYQDGYREVRTEAGLVTGMARDFAKYNYADIHGPAWCVAGWVARSEAEWKAAGLEAIAPFPANGEYHPVEDPDGHLFVRGDAVPTRALTTVAVLAIRYQMTLMHGSVERRRQTVNDAIRAVQEREKRESDALIDAQFDDAQNAFFNPKPGARSGHVSFGGI